MSREYNKKEPHQRCNACDFQKLKQLENNPVIRKLRDKIEQLNFRLTECRNENQMLKRNLQLARKMVCQEVGGQEVDFQALMKHGSDSGLRGRQENVLVLKTKVQELKDYLKELEGDPPKPQESPSEEFVKNQLPNDRKKLWRMELERRLARKSAEKDINPLVQECFELRRNLDTEKNRFKELNEEIKLLRAELRSQVEKNEEDFGIVKSFKTLENQLQETLAERAEIRRDLNGSRARNKRLTEEISLLKEELQVLQKRTSANNTLIDSLTSSHKSIQEAIDAEKAIVQQNVERYKKELMALQENHAMDGEILDHIQCIIYDRNDMIDEISKSVDEAMKKINDQKEHSTSAPQVVPSKESSILQSTSSTDNMPKEREDSATEELPDEQGKSDTNLIVRKLRLECAKYRVLCDAAKMEGDRLLLLTDNQDKKMNEIAIQVVETGRLIMQKNAEKKELLEKINKLQRSLSAKKRRSKIHAQSKNKLDELRIKNDTQREENDFLRNFLCSAVCAKGKDLQQLKEFITESKQFFDDSLDRIKESIKPQPSLEQNDAPVESAQESL